MSSTILQTNFDVWVTFILLSANAFNLYQSKILLFGIELNRSVTAILTHRYMEFQSSLGY